MELAKIGPALKSALYATEINQAGARMRRQRDCRPSLRRSATDADRKSSGRRSSKDWMLS
jgi:hypothetical protein